MAARAILAVGALLGLVGFGYTIFVETLRFPTDGQPCIRGMDALQPLIIGDTVQLVLGTLRSSNCTAEPQSGFTWATDNPARAATFADGRVAALSPGEFRVLATRDSSRARAFGYALPQGWGIRVTPDSATLRVGEAVTISLLPIDSLGEPLPAVRFQVYTPEFGQPGSATPGTGTSLFDVYSRQHVYQAEFRATRPGETVLTAFLGDQQQAVPVRVLP